MSLFQTMIEWAYMKYVLEPELAAEEKVTDEVILAVYQKHALKGIVRTDN